MRVLVVDDDDLVREMVCELLETAGIVVSAATNFRDATLLLVTDNWDVLLSDLQLEGRLTGLDLADEAAEKGIFAVIMSGAVDKRPEVEACGLRFLAKPFLRAELLAALELTPG
jgi:DNA-binding response OmpR family regulator